LSVSVTDCDKELAHLPVSDSGDDVAVYVTVMTNLTVSVTDIGMMTLAVHVTDVMTNLSVSVTDCNAAALVSLRYRQMRNLSVSVTDCDDVNDMNMREKSVTPLVI